MAASLPQLAGFCPDLSEIDRLIPHDPQAPSGNLGRNWRLVRYRLNEQHKNWLNWFIWSEIERSSQQLASHS